ncbi:MAG: hypothetical protein EBU00_07290 [Alphaproteobacteria bacterium]|nr:hypothetical protein [Alphaproteobacteria bacterium]
MIALTIILDALIILVMLLSAFLWFLASRSRLRRISRHEVLDYADINRIVTAVNRAQILNSRAAFMTALAALLAAFRVMIDLWAMK